MEEFKMKDMNGIKIIGVDNGYGNTKTTNHCFRTGILSYDTEPLFTREMGEAVLAVILYCCAGLSLRRGKGERKA